MLKQDKNGIFLKNTILLMIMLVVLLSLITPVYAENNYLFPSDIIDQSELSQYDMESENRYATQRQWTYPQDSQTSGKKAFYPDSSQYLTIDGQPESAQNQSQQYQSQHQYKQYNNIDSGSDWINDSEYYKYSKFKANNRQISQPELPYIPEQVPPLIQFSRELRYPGENNAMQSGERNIQRVMKKDFAPRAEAMQQRKYIQSYPNLLYPSEVEARRRPINKNTYSPNSFSSNSFPANSLPVKSDYDRPVERTRQNIRIQYVPVPVYSAPGTLPGTVPGVVTPGNMVPGYSHLSPDYNYGALNSGFPGSGFPGSGIPGSGLFSGLQDQRLFNRRGFNNSGLSPFLGTQYNPLTGHGIFPGASNPFDTFYKTYENHSQNISPFVSPDAMVPGFSMPDTFSPY